MKKTPFLLTLLASALLTACGGGGGGSSSGDNAGANDQNQGGQNSGDQGSGDQGSQTDAPVAAVLTFDVSQANYAAIKVGSGEWRRISTDQTTFTSTTPGENLEVLIASVCQDQASLNSPVSYDLEINAINLNENKTVDPTICSDHSFDSSQYGSVTTTANFSVSNVVSAEYGLGNEERKIFFEGNQHTADVALVVSNSGVFSVYTESGVVLTDGGRLDVGDTVLLSERIATDYDDVEYHVGSSDSEDRNALKSFNESMAYVIPSSSRLSGDFYHIVEDGDDFTYVQNVEEFRNVSVPDFSALKIYNDQFSTQGNQLTFSVSNLSDLKPEGLNRITLISEEDLPGQNYAGYFIDADLLVDGSFSLAIVDFESLPEFPFDLDVSVSDIATELSSNLVIRFENDVASSERGYKRISLFSQDR